MTKFIAATLRLLAKLAKRSQHASAITQSQACQLGELKGDAGVVLLLVACIETKL